MHDPSPGRVHVVLAGLAAAVPANSDYFFSFLISKVGVTASMYLLKPVEPSRRLRTA